MDDIVQLWIGEGCSRPMAIPRHEPIVVPADEIGQRVELRRKEQYYLARIKIFLGLVLPLVAQHAIQETLKQPITDTGGSMSGQIVGRLAEGLENR